MVMMMIMIIIIIVASVSSYTDKHAHFLFRRACESYHFCVKIKIYTPNTMTTVTQ